MITVEALAAIVGRKVVLRPAGKTRFRGLCPFHNERTPSFYVFQGRDGRGRFHCFGCGESGDGIDWLRKVEKKSYREAGGTRPDDPELERQREQQKQRARALQEYLDRNADCVDPEWMIGFAS